MKRGKQRLALLLLLGVLLAIASYTFWTTQLEPEYNGKKLSQWANLYEKSFRPPDPVIRNQAVFAAQQTRAQLLPYALKLMQKAPTPWWTAEVHKLAMSGYSRHIPHNLWQLLYYDPGRLSTTYFAMLGPDANSAVPELVTLLKQTKSDILCARAIYALCYIGKEGQDRLAEILVDPTYPKKRATANILEVLGPDGVNVNAMVPALVKNLADGDHEVAKATAYALGELAIDPDLAIPGLTNCLSSTDIYVRGAALDALGKYRASARPAVPALVAELDDPDPSVRKWATNSLRHVAPEYFTQSINLVPTPLDLSAP